MKTETAKHTPGPWVAEGMTIISGGDDGGAHIATIVDDYDPEGLAVADARLIAAAPDLLAACKMALDNFDHPFAEADDFVTRDEYQEFIRAAIAKAESTGND